MGTSRKIRSVLLVDRGASFGGALVVSARLAQSLDASRYRPVVVSALDWQTIRHHVPSRIAAYRVTEPYSYVAWGKTANFLSKIKPRFLFKLLLYACSLARSLVNLAYLVRLVFIILKEDVDIVHVNNTVDAVIAAKICRRKCVWHFHGYEKSGGLIDEYLLRKCDRFISISRYISGLAVADDIPADKLTTIHNPLSVTHRWLDADEKAVIREKYGIPSSAIVIAIFGRLVPWKGQLEFLRAIDIVAQQGLVQDFCVLIVGDSADDVDNYGFGLRAYVAEHGLQDVVRFTGYVMDVDPLYQISHVVVHASIGPEPFGLVITEAMQNGAAVVGSSLGAVPELIEDGVDGFVVDTRDANKLAARISQLISDPALRQSMSERGAARAQREFSPQPYAAAVQSVYDGMLSVGRRN